MRLERKHPSKLTRSEYTQVSRLHLTHGIMWDEFKVHAGHADSRVILVKDGSTVLAWASIFYCDIYRETVLHVYVARAHRRQGLGRRIIDYVNAMYPMMMKVFPHSTEAEGLFKHLKRSKV